MSWEENTPVSDSAVSASTADKHSSSAKEGEKEYTGHYDRGSDIVPNKHTLCMYISIHELKVHYITCRR